jgi:hypothetical protein
MKIERASISLSGSARADPKNGVARQSSVVGMTGMTWLAMQSRARHNPHSQPGAP